MQDSMPTVVPERRRAHRRVMGYACALVVLLGAAVGIWSVWNTQQRKLQIQTDSRVATVWVAGITFGPEQKLILGTETQRRFNSRGIHAFGDYKMLQSQYGGDPGGVEIW